MDCFEFIYLPTFVPKLDLLNLLTIACFFSQKNPFISGCQVGDRHQKRGYCDHGLRQQVRGVP